MPKLATDPPVSEVQRKAMWAAASGHSTLGIPQSVGREFTEADPGGKLPKSAKDMTKMDWKGLMHGLFKFLSEEAKEPEHAQDAPKGRAASIAFITNDGKMLFVKRADTEDNFPGHWCLPGGKVDGDESDEECAKREAHEELGECPLSGMRAIDKNKSPRSGWDHTTFAVPVDDEFEPTLNEDEHSEHSWEYVDEAPEPLHPGVRDTLDRVLGVKKAEDAASKKDAKDVTDPTGKLSATTRKEVESTQHREDMPAAAFLGPARTYPVKEKRDGEWVYTRNLLLAAARRARMQGRNDIARRADAIRAREFSGETEDGTGFDWAILNQRVGGLAFNHGLAFDKELARRYDEDGRLHVDSAVISKAVVNDYLGKEINEVMKGEPGWVMLEPERRYAMLRDPKALKDAEDSFNGLPILWTHEPTSAEDHPTQLTIGSTGTNAKFEPPFLRNDLVVWPKYATEAIDSGEKRELSCGYAYKADMTPGTYDGKHYDGIMTDIVGNHVALVKQGRVGAEAAIDAAIIDQAEIDAAIIDQATRQRAWGTPRRKAL